MIRHFFSAQFLLFVGVGGTAALCNWGSRILLSLWVPFSLSVVLAYCIGIATAFLLNSKFVFPAATRPMHLQVRDFILTNIAFMPVVWWASLQLVIFLPTLGIDVFIEELAHAIAIALPMFLTFLIYKFIAFKDS